MMNEQTPFKLKGWCNMLFHGISRYFVPILKYSFCAISSRELSVCAIFCTFYNYGQNIRPIKKVYQSPFNFSRLFFPACQIFWLSWPKFFDKRQIRLASQPLQTDRNGSKSDRKQKAQQIFETWLLNRSFQQYAISRKWFFSATST